eukprot:TRINITY_DN3370_c0_g9_i1.p1 TRINITY_DN3370_c0_g9~~TRINITY_DN3370_c0_g9_i1.p1  ORF type:complete len:261 (-),score=72.36 TRINITY_DN3370_c0_g9_i1:878-1543(-)
MKDVVLARPRTPAYETMKQTLGDKRPSVLAVKRIQYAANAKFRYNHKELPELCINQNETGLLKYNEPVIKTSKSRAKDAVRYKANKFIEADKIKAITSDVEAKEGVESSRRIVKLKGVISSAIKPTKENEEKVQADSKEEVKTYFAQDTSSEEEEAAFKFNNLPRTPKRSCTISCIFQDKDKQNLTNIEKPTSAKSTVVQIINPLTPLETVKKLLNQYSTT